MQRRVHPPIDLRTLLLMVRPWSFAMTAVAVTTGSLLALTYNSNFSIGLYVLTLLGMILAHGATNLINDYFDTRSGVDRPGAPTTLYRPHPLIEGALTPRQALLISLGLYGLAGLIGLYLALQRGWVLVLLALVGGLASFTYTAGPVHYKYRALGELSVFLMWGPLMMLGAYYVQAGDLAPAAEVIWVSLPIGLLVALVLLANNLKDLDYDRSTGVATLATLLGRRGTLKLYLGLIVAVYALSVLGTLSGALPLWGLLVLLSAPKAWRLVRLLESAPAIPPDADPRTAQLATQYGALLILALLLDRLFPLP